MCTEYIVRSILFSLEQHARSRVSRSAAWTPLYSMRHRRCQCFSSTPLRLYHTQSHPIMVYKECVHFISEICVYVKTKWASTLPPLLLNSHTSHTNTPSSVTALIFIVFPLNFWTNPHTKTATTHQRPLLARNGFVQIPVASQSHKLIDLVIYWFILWTSRRNPAGQNWPQENRVAQFKSMVGFLGGCYVNWSKYASVRKSNLSLKINKTHWD